MLEEAGAGVLFGALLERLLFVAVEQRCTLKCIFSPVMVVQLLLDGRVFIGGGNGHLLGVLLQVLDKPQVFLRGLELVLSELLRLLLLLESDIVSWSGLLL